MTSIAPAQFDQIPQYNAGDDLQEFLTRLASILDSNFGKVQIAATVYQVGDASFPAVIYANDDQGRPLIRPEGVYAYNASDFSTPVAPNIVAIDTDELVDLAISTGKLKDLVVLTAKIGDLAVVNAKIDDLAVNNAKIANLAVDAAKIALATITNAQIANATILGANIANATIGTANIANAAITNALIANATITSAKINDLDANKINAGTLAAGVIYAGQINALQVNAGTFTGFTFQTASPSGASTVMSASTNDLRSYDSSGTLVASIGQLSFGGAVWAKSASPLFAAAYFENAAPGTVISVQQTSVAPGIPGAFFSAINNHAVSANSTSGIGLIATSSSSQGVKGISSSSYGVYGVSSGERGVWGESTSSNGGDFKNVSASGGWGSVGVPNAFGGWAFYAQVGAYGPFTGAHEGLIRKDSLALPGDCLSDVELIANSGWGDTILHVRVSQHAKDPSAIGIFTGQRWEMDTSNPPAAMRDLSKQTLEVLAEEFDLVKFNGLGEGMCKTMGQVEKGDLLCTSPVQGVLMAQGSDKLHSYTVARARDRSRKDGKTPCIYLSG